MSPKHDYYLNHQGSSVSSTYFSNKSSSKPETRDAYLKMQPAMSPHFLIGPESGPTTIEASYEGEILGKATIPDAKTMQEEPPVFEARNKKKKKTLKKVD